MDRKTLQARVVMLERENAGLRHDLERTMKNHNADVNAAEPKPPETYGERLDRIVDDLTYVANAMNLDKSFTEARLAQRALVAVDTLHQCNSAWFNDLEWGWMPSKED